jgi:hypothetical protein
MYLIGHSINIIFFLGITYFSSTDSMSNMSDTTSKIRIVAVFVSVDKFYVCKEYIFITNLILAAPMT